jgi:hypothetical protein
VASVAVCWRLADTTHPRCTSHVSCVCWCLQDASHAPSLCLPCAVTLKSTLLECGGFALAVTYSQSAMCPALRCAALLTRTRPAKDTIRDFRPKVAWTELALNSIVDEVTLEELKTTQRVLFREKAEYLVLAGKAGEGVGGIITEILDEVCGVIVL